MLRTFLERRRGLHLLPLLLTCFLVTWTAVVYPFSKYGDMWAILPALITAPAVLLAHATLVVLGPNRWRELAYAGLHLAIFSVVWIGALMLISKDSF